MGPWQIETEEGLTRWIYFISTAFFGNTSLRAHSKEGAFFFFSGTLPLLVNELLGI